MVQSYVSSMKQEYISYWQNTLQHSQKLEFYSGAPWVTKFIYPRKFGYDVAYAGPPTHTHTSCKAMSNVTIDLAQLD